MTTTSSVNLTSAAWKSSVAGIAANTASQVLYPLETVKLRFQANNHAKNNPIPAYRGIFHALYNIYKTEGFASMYRGVTMSLTAGALANSIFFYLYADGKNRYGYDKQNPYGIKGILISLRAGIAAMAVTAPLWTIKTRMALF